jgi:putative ribosome biogenesis GTPase RsgA
MTQKRTILLIGKTGSGKSTLANVLLNKDDEFVEVFKVSDSVNSETKESQIAEFEHGGINYKVIDTIGLADTRFSREEVLKK